MTCQCSGCGRCTLGDCVKQPDEFLLPLAWARFGFWEGVGFMTTEEHADAVKILPGLIEQGRQLQDELEDDA